MADQQTEGQDPTTPQPSRADDRIAELLEAGRKRDEQWAAERAAWEARTASLETQSRRDFLALQGIADASIQDFLYFEYGRTPEKDRPDFRSWVAKQATDGHLERWKTPSQVETDPMDVAISALMTPPETPTRTAPNPGAKVTTSPVLPSITTDQQSAWLRRSTSADRMAYYKAQQGAKKS